VAFTKFKVDPADRLDYGFWYADPKDPFLSDGETLSTSTWTLYDEDWNVVTDVTVDDDTSTSTTTTVFFGPADDDAAIRGQTRFLTNHVETNQDRAKDRSYQFTFEEQ
jgi:hypothetical protein